MLDQLLSPYYKSKKNILIKLVNKVHSLLGPICLTALKMESEEIWVVVNMLLQCMEKCYYLIDIVWCFIVNVHHSIHITTNPSCVLDICICLNYYSYYQLLLFIRGRLCSTRDKDTSYYSSSEVDFAVPEIRILTVPTVCLPLSIK